MRHLRTFKSMRPDLESGRPLFGWYVTFQIPDIVEMIGGLWDWLWIDLQHSPIDMEATLSIIRTAEAAGTYSLVRVGKNDSFQIASALDLGASGVIVPMVNTVEEAREVVRAAKFPPAGRRSYGSRRVAALYGLDYADRANAETVVFVQLESVQALSNAEAIAAVEGIDGLIFSSDDITREKEVTVVLPRPANLWAAEKGIVASAAGKYGKVAGCFCDSPASLREALKTGYRLIVGAEEDVVILEGSARILKWIAETTAETLAKNFVKRPTK